MISPSLRQRPAKKTIRLTAFIQTAIGQTQSLRIRTNPATSVTSNLLVEVILSTSLSESVIETINFNRGESEAIQMYMGTSYKTATIRSITPSEDSNYIYTF